MKITTFVCLTFVVAAFAVPAFLYPRLPDPMPSHWDLQGHVNGFMPKPLGAFFGSLMTLVLWFFMGILPRISPRGFTVEFPRAYEAIRMVITAFMAAVAIIIPLAAIGTRIDMSRVILGGTGVLLAVIGNFLSKTTRNFWVGIRTPWTLASDEVWLRTHRLGAKMFVIGGIVVAVCGLVGAPMPIWLAAVLVPGLVPIVYSYVIYRRIEG